MVWKGRSMVWYGMGRWKYGMVWEGRRLLLEGPVTGRKKAWLVTMAKWP